jgi:hypothetical protein
VELQSPCCSPSSFFSFEQVFGEEFADQLAAAVDSPIVERYAFEIVGPPLALP